MTVESDTLGYGAARSSDLHGYCARDVRAVMLAP